MQQRDLGQFPYREYIWGIGGTARYAKIAGHTNQNFYVDSGHGNASDDNDGTDPEAPFLTVQAAIDSPFLTDFSTIFVAGPVTESVVVGAADPDSVSIIGVGAPRNAPTWTAAVAAGTAFTMRRPGWVVEGFEFVAGAGGTSIQMDWVPGSSYEANRCVIRGNHFNGAWAGLYGIAMSGAPYDVWIIGNEFREYRRADNSAIALTVIDSSEANPYMCVVKDNLFWENENHVRSLNDDRGWNCSVFQHNIFNEGVLINAVSMLDLRGGTRGENIVVENIFMGDYSNTGGYWANAANPGMWVGNIAQDVAEAEVADNGFTVAVPAA